MLCQQERVTCRLRVDIGAAKQTHAEARKRPTVLDMAENMQNLYVCQE
jgi:hypothetical protein